MTMRRIALIGYPAEYFLPFAKSLEQADFDIFWVCALRADAQYLLRDRVSASRILDINHNFQSGSRRLDQCREVLWSFENEVDPKVNDIILMDRLINQKDWRFSIEYLHHVATSINGFLKSNKITFVSSWRDTAIQMIAMLISRKLGVPFVIPTRIRIPQEVYGFCTAHHTESFVTLREPNPDDVSWAETFLKKYESRDLRPALKKSTRNFTDIIRLLPTHLKAFRYELRRSFSDIGNDYTRYPIGRLVRMYVRRRINQIRYKLFNPSERNLPQNQRFCIYALHTQPESSIDVQGSYFSDQLELIRHIARSLPASHLLYVKVHPTDIDGKTLDFYRRIKSIPSVVLVDYSVDSRSLLKHASIVFALTGTIAYEAALIQKPVIVFAKNFFNSLPSVHSCATPTALPDLISRLLSNREPVGDAHKQTVLFLAKMRASCFDGEVSRTYGTSNEPLRPSDLSQLQFAYNLVYRALTKKCPA